MLDLEREFELKLADGKTAVWTGTSGVDASRRYVAAHPAATVVAWRTWPRHGVFPHPDLGRIVEPGRGLNRT
jgi:hypothetical protein